VGEEAADAELWVPWREYGVDPALVRKADGPGEVLSVSASGLRVALPGCEALVLEAKEG